MRRPRNRPAEAVAAAKGQRKLALSRFDAASSEPMPAMTEPLLRVAELTKAFGASKVVDSLSFEIHPGECLGVIGPNGAGKTTTIRMCLGLISAQSGEIEIFGLPIPKQVLEAKKRIGVVTQFDSLDPDFNCAENLRVYGAYFGLPRATIDERVPKPVSYT